MFWKAIFYVVFGPILIMEWIGRKICEGGAPKPKNWCGELEYKIKRKEDV